MPRIFISYRREDSIAYAGRVYDRLSSEFGPANVFMDIDSLEPGVEFAEMLEQTIASCDVFVAVIGRQWLTARDEAGNVRLSNPHDFVSLEIGVALGRGSIRVVPVLVGGAGMPRSSELPEPLLDLSKRNALELPDRGFHQALGRLIQSIKRTEPEPVGSEEAQRQWNAERAHLPATQPQDDRLVQEKPNLKEHEQTASQESVALLKGERKLRPMLIAGTLAGTIMLTAGGLFIANKGKVSEHPDHSLQRAPVNPRVRRSVAVMGFQNLSGKPVDVPFSAILSEYLTSELESGETVRIAAREDVDRVKRDLALADSSGYGKNSLAKISKALDYEFVVSGSYFLNQSDGTIRVDLRLQNVQTGETVTGFSEKGTQSDLAGLVRRLGDRVYGKLGVLPARDEAIAVAAALPAGSDAARFYASGLVKLRAFDLLGARDDLERALKSDPKSAMAHLALAKALWELGYDGQAITECSEARNLTRTLSLRDRKRIDGYYWRITGSWDQAIETYRDLWKWYPDEPEYALELAEVQTDSGKPQAALATLDELRTTFKQAASDPRVDLQEAEAARQAQDYKKQQKAAVAALRKASAASSKLFTAAAYWESCAALASLGDSRGAEKDCELANQSADLGAGQKIKADSLSMLASIMTNQGKISQAMELRQEALRIVRQIDSRKRISAALMNLAILQFSQNELQEADLNFEEAAVVAKEIGDKDQLLRLAVNKSDRLYDGGEYFAAKQSYEKVLVAAEESNNKQEIATTLQRLGAILYLLGDLQQAEKDLRQAIAVADDLRSPAIRASSLSLLGDVLLARGEVDAARKAYTDAQDRFVKQDDQASVAGCRESLASLAIEEGNARQAELWAREAVEEFQKEKAVDSEASAHETLALALLAQGKLQEAGKEISSATNLSPEDRTIRMSLAITSASYNARVGKSAEATKSLDGVLSQASQMKLVGFQLEAKLAQAEIERSSNIGAARAQLQLVERDARARGFLLIAAKAHREAEPVRK